VFIRIIASLRVVCPSYTIPENAFSGNGFSETVYMRRVEVRGTREAYRSGMVPAEAGDWQLSVRPVGVDADFLGLGVICKRKDGTR